MEEIIKAKDSLPSMLVRLKQMINFVLRRQDQSPSHDDCHGDSRLHCHPPFEVVGDRTLRRDTSEQRKRPVPQILNLHVIPATFVGLKRQVLFGSCGWAALVGTDSVRILGDVLPEDDFFLCFRIALLIELWV
jgi:hypothetical protein